MGTNVQMETEKSNAPQTMNGALMLIEALKREKVEVIFGYPLAELFYRSTIKFTILVYFMSCQDMSKERFTQRRDTQEYLVIRRCYCHIRTGATNLVTGIADAMIDSLPMVIFTGQVATSVIGSDAFQEADVLGITMPITKHSYQVRRPEELPGVIKEAFHIATTGRPYPVLIDIPKDVAGIEGTFEYDQPIDL